ncbi:MAG TPA: hypothetical protein VM123_16525 [archaeon]|nr:hypothetical protein [archaeon]
MIRQYLKITLLFFLASGAALAARSDDLESRAAIIRRELAGLETQRAELVLCKDSLSRQADSLASEIAELKSRIAQNYSRLDQFRLQERLRASQVLADSLDKLTLKILELEKRLSRRTLEVISFYTAAIDSLSLELQASRNRAGKGELLKRIERLRQERAIFSDLGESPPAKGREGARLSLEKLAGAARIGPRDSPEELREKANFLEDMAGKWMRALGKLEENLDRISEEGAMRKRLGEFAQEISLFDNAGVSSRAGQRSQATPATGQETYRAPDEGTLMLKNESLPPEAEGLKSLDLELFNLEGDLWLQRNLENLSADEIEAAIRVLEARRDSLENDLRTLRELEQSLRSRAVELESKKEGAPPQ